MVVVIGGMNLSVGSVGALATVVSGLMMQNLGLPTYLVFILTTLTGALCGLIEEIRNLMKGAAFANARFLSRKSPGRPISFSTTKLRGI